MQQKNEEWLNHIFNIAKQYREKSPLVEALQFHETTTVRIWSTEKAMYFNYTIEPSQWVVKDRLGQYTVLTNDQFVARYNPTHDTAL